MNRRDLFRRIGGAFCAVAMELGWREPEVAALNPSFTDANEWGVCINGQWLNVGPRYDWVEGTGWVKSMVLAQRFGDTNAQEPNPDYVDSEK